MRLIQIVHRHGDRSPLVNAYLNSTLENNENSIWQKKVLGDHVFGELTQVGYKQCIGLGKRLKGLVDGMDEYSVYSTNYDRTKLSVTGVLKGMDIKTMPAIVVQDMHQDVINPYDANPIVMEWKRELESVGEFYRREREVKDVKQLITQRLSYFKEDTFNWIKAADYFTCRRAHGLDIDDGLKNVEKKTMQHVAFRFEQFYKDSRIVKVLAGKLVDAMKFEMENGVKNKVVLYSGHDVTILALLAALQLPGPYPYYWPAYATSLAVCMEKESIDIYLDHIKIVDKLSLSVFISHTV